MEKNKTINLPNDFYEMWGKWLNEVKSLPKDICDLTKAKTDYGYIYEFYFNGVEKAKIYGNLFLNDKGIDKPIIVLYHGLGAIMSTEGYQEILGYWLSAGYSVIGMDSRKQGGKTIDNLSYDFEQYGIQAYNILTLEKYYSKLLFQDALQLIEIIDSFAELKNKKIVVTGGSKGGELSLVASSWSKRVSLCLCDIPSGCNLGKRVMGRHGSYQGVFQLITDYPNLESVVFKNLSYFDIINFAHLIEIPVLASVGTVDEVCPAEFFLEAYNRIKAKKQLISYEGYGHGGFDKIHMPLKYAFIEKYRLEKTDD